jgi:hypothetical protein
MEVNNIYIYRIFHVKNLEYILQKGLFCPRLSKNTDQDYVGIGEAELITLRTNHSITTVNSNKIVCPSSEYLPFYFSARSVMLYRIFTGY